MGTGIGHCEHPRSARGIDETGGVGLQYVCDPERGGCGAPLGPVGARH